MVVYFGAEEEIQIYKVGPIPIPLSYPIPDGSMTAEPLPDPPAFNKRNIDSAEYEAMEPIIEVAMATLDDLCLESYGSTYADGLITWTDSSPRGIEVGRRQTWLWFLEYKDGYYIRPIGLEFLFDHHGVDPNNWSIISVWQSTSRFVAPHDT